MSEETDWDAPDEEGVIDFEDMAPEKEPPKPKPQREEPPKATQKIHVEPPPKKEEAGMSEKQEKSINNAAKAAQKLSKELETLDFQVEKFTKFEKTVSSFKIKNTIAVAIVAMIVGGYVGSFAQKELNDYYINQELINKIGEAKSNNDFIKKGEAQGLIFAMDNERLVVYSSSTNKAVSTFQYDKHQGLQLTLKKIQK